jgi:hypothetical protein
MKMCSGCKQCLEVSEFNKNSRRHDGYQTMCRSCQRDYYSKRYYDPNGSERKRLERNREKNKELRREIIRGAKSIPCMDCGVEYPYYVMDFDHRDPKEKRYTVGMMVGQGQPLDQLRQEIAKCDVVCSNCHRIRTHG